MIKLVAGDYECWCDQIPNTCPLCHHSIEPKYLVGTVRRLDGIGGIWVEFAFQCPRNACRQIFIGRYDGQLDRNVNAPIVVLRETAPASPIPPFHPEDVAKASPQFVAVHAEAAAAEAWGLKQVAGCGYRKALEFLIKDYCVAENPPETETIKAEFLGTVIKNRIVDPRIKEVARRATWLGNDESHYVRVWADKDLSDLKALILLTVSWINTSLLTKRYLKEMPE